MTRTTPLTTRVLVACALIVIAFGAWLRLSGLERKLYWYDEIATLITLSGHSQDDMRRLYDGRPQTAASLRRFQAPNDDHGVAGVITSMLADEPQSSVAYLILARAAVRALGAVGPRALSAVANLCAVFVMGLLAFRLFDVESGWLAAALVATSPLHIRYAQEARAYGLWSLAVSLGTLLLVRAIRTGAALAWTLYGLTMAAALYVHLISLLVLVAHAVYVVWHVSQLPDRSRKWIHPGGGFAVALALYGPWVMVVAAHRHAAERELSWTSRRFALAHLGRRWISTATNVFIHSGADGGLVGGSSAPSMVAARAGVAAAVLAVILFSAWSLARTRPRTSTALVALVGLVPLLGLALPDMAFGGQRSMIPRYLLPFWIALELTVAGGLGRKLFRVDGRIGTGMVVAAGLLVAGLASACLAHPLVAWWDTGPEDLRAIAHASELIHARSSPTVVSDVEPRWVLVLLQTLRDDVALRLVSDPARVDWTAARQPGSAFLFMPSPRLLRAATAAGLSLRQCVDAENVSLWCSLPEGRPW